MKPVPALPANDAQVPEATETRRYFNRELSWLAFNRRVLEEACNPAHPLLERLRFLSISGSNLDEFFMVRVAGLKGQQLQGIDDPSADGRSPGQQLAEIEAEVNRLVDQQQSEWQQLHRLLAEQGIVVHGAGSDVEKLRRALRQYFLDQIFPILTPQVLDPAHPFPFIPNRGVGVIFDLQRKATGDTVRELVMIPASLARFVPVPGEPGGFPHDDHEKREDGDAEEADGGPADPILPGHHLAHEIVQPDHRRQADEAADRGKKDAAPAPAALERRQRPHRCRKLR